ncbi:MAG: type IV pilus modification PilV family protein [Caldisericum sp.]|uniref:type IV pilus modification PilV family protein n=1 Tax=Caldisericum sp. TaxID=2499687 RepID=UPI003D13A056
MNKRRRGFTIIETMISIVIVTFIVVAVTTGAISMNVSEKRKESFQEAKDIANYVIDYIRSRNVTYDNNLGFNVNLFGNDENHPLPGLIDNYGNPLSINVNPITPNGKYNDKPSAFYFSLQGFVSLGENGYIIDSNPSLEDANLFTSSGKYYDRVTSNPIVVRFPLSATINGAPNPNKINFFNPGLNYIPKIYVKANAFTDGRNPNYTPYFTNDGSLSSKTTDYNGFRVLTKVVARKQKASDPDHVQWFDVEVTVYWMEGKLEKSYQTKTKLTVYGGS